MFIQTMFLFFAGKEKKLYQTCLDSGVISQHMGYIILVGIQRTHAATRTACCAGVIVIQLLFFFSFFFLLPENSAMPAPSLRVPMFSTDARRKG